MNALPTHLRRNGIAYLALFFAVGGGAAYAAGSGSSGAEKSQGTLSAGKTERGVYHVDAFKPDSFGDAAVSFPIPLAKAPKLHFIQMGATPPAACPGTALRPKAKPGHLCVYEADEENRADMSVPFGYGDSRDKLGFQLEVQPASSSDYMMSKGTWAVNGR
jgi:hypothetical protein